MRVRNLNGFAPVTTWTVSVHVPDGEITNVWNATPVADSPTTFTPAPWSPPIGFSGTAEFGFQGTGEPPSGYVSCLPY